MDVYFWGFGGHRSNSVWEMEMKDIYRTLINGISEVNIKFLHEISLVSII